MNANLGPVIIGCSDSSGSTFLSFFLDRHPDIASLGELYLFNKRIAYDDFATLRKYRHIIRRVGVSSNPIDPATTILNDLQSYGLSSRTVWDWVGNSSSIVGVSELFARYLSNSTGKSTWIEKTPSNARLASRFLAAYPSGRLIHLVRDPRDVLLSLYARHPEKGILHGVETWLTAVCAAHACRDDPRVLEVRYEDLVTDTHGVAARICEFVGVEYQSNYFVGDSYRTRVGARSEGHASWAARPTSEPSPASVFRWKHSDESLDIYGKYRLTESMAELLNAERVSLAEMASRYGYEPFYSSDRNKERNRYRGGDPHLKSWPFRICYDTRERPCSIEL